MSGPNTAFSMALLRSVSFTGPGVVEMCACVRACACVCVCVKEREEEEEQGGPLHAPAPNTIFSVTVAFLIKGDCGA